MVAAYSATGIPAASLGLFFIAMIPLRRWMAQRQWRLTPVHMALVSAGIGYLTGIVVSTGPINAPFFMAYGLLKGAYLSTEANSSLAVHLAKALIFRQRDAMPWDTLLKGLIVCSKLTAGSVIAKRFVLKLDADTFRLWMDGLLLMAGVAAVAYQCGGRGTKALTPRPASHSHRPWAASSGCLPRCHSQARVKPSRGPAVSQVVRACSTWGQGVSSRSE